MARADRTGALAPALVCVASHREGEAVLRGLGAPPDAHVAPDWTLIRAHVTPTWIDMVITGVGKANAAAAAARAIEPLRHRLVVSLGIGGALPGCEAALGALVLGHESVFADEGAATPEAFVDVARMGFPPAPGVTGVSLPGDRRAMNALRHLAQAEGAIATVSTCAGTDALAEETARRTGALVEAMEGAAVALTAHRMGVAFVEARVISNTTGNRAAQQWDLTGALSALERAAAGLAEALNPDGSGPSSREARRAS